VSPSLWLRRRWLRRLPIVECLLVDVRQRELTIKGQEILTADKVAIRVSILVQFRVTDPKAAVHTVDNFEDRLYSDVQLAARRSLASMTLEEILTNRTRLSEDILSDVKEAAAGCGVAIWRADVKDLIFPGNLQEIMNRVLAAERNSQAQLVEARTRAEVEQIQAQSRAETTRREAQAEAEARRLRDQADAEALPVQAEAEARAYEERVKAAEALEGHFALRVCRTARRSSEPQDEVRLLGGVPKRTVEIGAMIQTLLAALRALIRSTPSGDTAGSLHTIAAVGKRLFRCPGSGTGLVWWSPGRLRGTGRTAGFGL
jgi:regulator of protease activity HflC (stomatin/prohibitin superfamily)